MRVLKRKTVICIKFTVEQKLQLATPTYKARKEKELQKKTASPSLVDPSTVAVVGKVESAKGYSSDRGENPTKKKKISHKSPKKTSKPPKVPDFHADLKTLDDKWSERFTRLEALFLSKSFQLPVEPVQSSNVVVSEKPFIPPAQQSTSQSPATGLTSKKKTATQPVEAPGVKKLATQPVEAPGAGTEIPPTDQTAVSSASASVSSRPEVQPPGPTTADQPEDFASEDDQFSDQPDLSLDEEGELSEVLSVGPDREELVETDQELSAEQTYRETLRGVRSFMGWDQVPEFDSSSSV